MLVEVKITVLSVCGLSAPCHRHSWGSSIAGRWLQPRVVGEEKSCGLYCTIAMGISLSYFISATNTFKATSSSGLGLWSIS